LVRRGAPNLLLLLEGIAVRRRGSAALIAVAVLSLLILSLHQEETYRVIYEGEDVHALLLITAREACKSPDKSAMLFARAQTLEKHVKVKSYTVSVIENSSNYERGTLLCAARVSTSIGEDAFALNYTYKLVGLRVDELTGRILRIYAVSAYQYFKMPVYNYTIQLSVALQPLCPHDYVNGDLAVRGLGPCVLADKWGLKLVIPGG